MMDSESLQARQTAETLSGNVAGHLSPEGVHRPTLSVTLEEGELWSRFGGDLTNEMILTKTGRRMFPGIKVRIGGLEPKAFYSILLEFKQIGETKLKYINGEWLSGTCCKVSSFHCFVLIKY
jgi:hypothetical protein